MLYVVIKYLQKLWEVVGRNGLKLSEEVEKIEKIEKEKGKSLVNIEQGHIKCLHIYVYVSILHVCV